MPFAEQREALQAQVRNLEDLLKQAQAVSRNLEERTAELEGQTESFADDTTLAQVAGTARRARQELAALLKAVGVTRARLDG